MGQRQALSRFWVVSVAVIAILIPVASAIYSLQLMPRFGIIIYKEQFLALFLSLCVSISFLTKTASGNAVERLSWYDIIFALLALSVGGYIFIEYGNIIRTLGIITTDKVIVSVIGLTLLLEATRRHAGWVMVSVGLVALAYAYFGHYLRYSARRGGNHCHQLRNLRAVVVFGGRRHSDLGFRAGTHGAAAWRARQSGHYVECTLWFAFGQLLG